MAKDEDGEEYEGVYDGEGREEMVRNDEMTPEEEAFMSGYDEVPEEKESDQGDKAYEDSFEETKPKKRK